MSSTSTETGVLEELGEKAGPKLLYVTTGQDLWLNVNPELPTICVDMTTHKIFKQEGEVQEDESRNRTGIRVKGLVELRGSVCDN